MWKLKHSNSSFAFRWTHVDDTENKFYRSNSENKTQSSVEQRNYHDYRRLIFDVFLSSQHIYIESFHQIAFQ